MEVDVRSTAALPGFVPWLYLVIGVEVGFGRSKDDGEAASRLGCFLSLVGEV